MAAGLLAWHTDLRSKSGCPQDDFPYHGSSWPTAVSKRERRQSQHVHTEAFTKKHALKEDVLSVGSFVTDTDFLIHATEPWFNHVEGLQAIGSEANAGSSCGVSISVIGALDQLASHTLLPRTRPQPHTV